MTDTPRMSLPLLSPSQAQKHVTMNEALARIDALTHLTLASIDVATPPAVPVEGDMYSVPQGAVNAWAGQAGMLAIAVNGGWVFVPPRRGWRAMVLDRGLPAIHSGADWRIGALTLGASGAGLSVAIVEFDQPVAGGATVTTAPVIPPRATVFGITGRVVEAIVGGATSWSLGVAGDPGRFGTGLGTGLNSWVNGPAAPIVYWDATPLVLTAAGGGFSGGRVRFAVHYTELFLPDPV
ncbi:DUF2793 domain-containing protein [Roseicyclus marinus]|uniref:DUF2793 domain-containing protein n=1 Tax=Roseicyclus marinus TaxID=2161673 RepID=UPI00240EE17F|nr:DUF2793 domain-containing protein [Roseicyclus marinus]MDG3042862.1 DUF2793 domain-containing protein [Roseicyclus marinus]